MTFTSSSVRAAFGVIIALSCASSFAEECPVLEGHYVCTLPTGSKKDLKITQTGHGKDTEYSFETFYLDQEDEPRIKVVKYVADHVLREDPYAIFVNTFSRAWCDLDPVPTFHIYSEVRHETGAKLIFTSDYRTTPTFTITGSVHQTPPPREALNPAITHCERQ